MGGEFHSRFSAQSSSTATSSEEASARLTHYAIKAPNANAFAERWIRTIRQQVLDHLLILNEAHLRRVLNEYINYYNARRPHQGLEQQSPIPRAQPITVGQVERRKILGGIISDYFRAPQDAVACLS